MMAKQNFIDREKEIYEKVIRDYERDKSVFNRTLAAGHSHPLLELFAPGKVFRDDLNYHERKVEGKRVYIVGDGSFLSRAGVDKIHRDLVNRILGDPSSWVFLREESSLYLEDPVARFFVTNRYLEELSSVLGVVYDSALKDPHHSDVCSALEKKFNISMKDLDRYRLMEFFRTRAEVGASRHINGEMIEDMSEFLGKPSRYIRELLRDNPLDAAAELRIVRAWNQLTRENFLDVLKGYPDATNLLIAVEKQRVPLFLEQGLNV